MIASIQIDIPTDELAEICRRYQVRELALFGSVLRDDFDDQSDIDVLVEFNPEARIGFIALQDLQEDLTTLFGRPVDVVTKNGISRYLREPVLSAAQVLYAA